MGGSWLFSAGSWKPRCILPVGLVAQSGPTLCNPRDYSPPGTSVPGDSPGKNTRVGCHVLLQGIFPTQGLKACLLWLLHCRLILYPLSHWESPWCILHSTEWGLMGRRATASPRGLMKRLSLGGGCSRRSRMASDGSVCLSLLGPGERPGSRPWSVGGTRGPSAA